MMKKKLLTILMRPLSLLNRLLPKKEMVFFYSNLGFRDNVKAFYDYLIQEGFHKRVPIVVSTNEAGLYRASAPERVKFVGTVRGIFYFLRARTAFYSFGKYPIKPGRGQTVVNLWHGMPLKRIGNMERGKEKIDYNYFTKIIATSELFCPILMESFCCSREQVDVLGQPRNDELFWDDREADARVRSGCEKLILWLPTYREETLELPLPCLTLKEAGLLNTALKELDCRMVVKLHPLQKFTKELPSFSHLVFLTQEELTRQRLSLYAMMRASDALVTDYSSVFFDYLLLDHPIAFTLDDVDQYKIERGFTLENPLDYMPGERVTDLSGILRFVGSVYQGEDGYREDRDRVNRLVNTYRDGESAKRIAAKYLGKR